MHACCAHRCRNERKAVARRLPCFDSVPSIDLRIRSRVTGLSSEVAYVPGDFLDLGSCPATDLALRGMVKDGTLRRLARGLYDRRQTHLALGALACVFGGVLLGESNFR